MCYFLVGVDELSVSCVVLGLLSVRHILHVPMRLLHICSPASVVGTALPKLFLPSYDFLGVLVPTNGDAYEADLFLRRLLYIHQIRVQYEANIQPIND